MSLCLFMHFCSNCYLGIITSMIHKRFLVGIPKRQEFRRHGNKLVAAPSLWNVTICGQEELWVFLSFSVTLLFFLFPSLLTFRPEEVTNTFLSLLSISSLPFSLPCHLCFYIRFSQTASHFSESTIHS